MNKATKFLVGVVAAAGVATGAAATAQAAPVGYHAAACSTSVFTVTWSAAGVYSAAIRDDAHLLFTKHQGDRVTGPTGGTGTNWTKVYLGSGGIGFMPKDSVTYVGCN